jgi:hypothetical protein
VLLHAQQVDECRLLVWRQVLLVSARRERGGGGSEARNSVERKYEVARDVR